jgi:hypothetical protein
VTDVSADVNGAAKRTNDELLCHVASIPRKDVYSQVASDGAWSRSKRVGGSQKSSALLDGVLAWKRRDRVIVSSEFASATDEGDLPWKTRATTGPEDMYLTKPGKKGFPLRSA